MWCFWRVILEHLHHTNINPSGFMFFILTIDPRVHQDSETSPSKSYTGVSGVQRFSTAGFTHWPIYISVLKDSGGLTAKASQTYVHIYQRCLIDILRLWPVMTKGNIDLTYCSLFLCLFICTVFTVIVQRHSSGYIYIYFFYVIVLYSG